MADEKGKIIENSINELIAEAVKGGGHLIIVDKKRNKFMLRLTDAVTVHFFGGYKGDNENH